MNDWERVGFDDWFDNGGTYHKHNLHEQHIKCPGGEFDYGAIATHRYRNDPTWDALSNAYYSNIVPIDC
jgi:hypothetical protein